MGQGLFTKCLQVASRALDIPITKITMLDTSTDKTANAPITGGSQGADVHGIAVKVNKCSHSNNDKLKIPVFLIISLHYQNKIRAYFAQGYQGKVISTMTTIIGNATFAIALFCRRFKLAMLSEYLTFLFVVFCNGGE